MGPGRLEALTEGVFAIALTLLVLDLPKPIDAPSLSHALAQHWPAYVAYLVSFVTIGLLWIEHHGMMSAVRAVDRRFLEVTLAFLLCISIVPWPTALAADYATHGFANARMAAVLYAGTMCMMGVTFFLGWRYLTDHPALVAQPARPAFPAGARRALLDGLVYVFAALVAIFSPLASFYIDGLIAGYFAASRTAVPGLIAQAGPDSTPLDV